MIRHGMVCITCHDMSCDVQASVDGEMLMELLHHEELLSTELGVTKQLHRMKLLREIGKLMQPHGMQRQISTTSSHGSQGQMMIPMSTSASVPPRVITPATVTSTSLATAQRAISAPSHVINTNPLGISLRSSLEKIAILNPQTQHVHASRQAHASHDVKQHESDDDDGPTGFVLHDGSAQETIIPSIAHPTLVIQTSTSQRSTSSTSHKRTSADGTRTIPDPRQIPYDELILKHEIGR